MAPARTEARRRVWRCASWSTSRQGPGRPAAGTRVCRPSYGVLAPDPSDPTAGVPPEEVALLRERQAFWTDEERGYSHIQGTKPQTLGDGLNDSPVDLAAWIVAKCRSPRLRRRSRDEVQQG